jgi:hypothetical protein
MQRAALEENVGTQSRTVMNRISLDVEDDALDIFEPCTFDHPLTLSSLRQFSLPRAVPALQSSTPDSWLQTKGKMMNP